MLGKKVDDAWSGPRSSSLGHTHERATAKSRSFRLPANSSLAHRRALESRGASRISNPLAPIDFSFFFSLLFLHMQKLKVSTCLAIEQKREEWRYRFTPEWYLFKSICNIEVGNKNCNQCFLWILACTVKKRVLPKEEMMSVLDKTVLLTVHTRNHEKSLLQFLIPTEKGMDGAGMFHVELRLMDFPVLPNKRDDFVDSVYTLDMLWICLKFYRAASAL